MTSRVLTLCMSALAALLSGCVLGGGRQLPPPIAAADESRIRQAHFPYTVGVRRPADAPQWYISEVDKLVHALQNLRMFDRLGYVDEFKSPPDIEMKNRYSEGIPNVIPIWSVVTFGIVPTFCSGTAGYELDFGSEFGTTPTRVEYKFKQEFVFGWSGPLIRPDVSWEFIPSLISPRYDRFARQLALKIVDRLPSAPAVSDRDRPKP